MSVQLIHRLRDQDPEITPALAWLDRRLAAQDTTADDVVRDVHRRQGSANVTVRNIITSMRLISELDWKELFERYSLVDEILDSGAGFKAMDFSTRNRYRGAIEELSRGSRHTELQVAHSAMLSAATALKSSASTEDRRTGDPGYYLLAGGRRAFEQKIGFRLPWRQLFVRLNRVFGIGGYIGAIAIATVALLSLPLMALAATGNADAKLVLLAALGVIPAVDAAVALVNRLMSFGFGATSLPALELKDGVPVELRTLVAVPTLLTSLQSIEEHIERLEIYYLASPDGRCTSRFCPDWADARSEHSEDDRALLAAATAGISRLNRRYGPRPEAPASFCCIVVVFGTRVKAVGWVGAQAR